MIFKRFATRRQRGASGVRGAFCRIEERQSWKFVLRSTLSVMATAGMTVSGTSLQAASPAISKLVTIKGRHALLVDDRPFLMLGAQVHNSSNYPAMLPKVWPTIRALHANTVEVPIAWEQIEPVEGRFDFSFLDQLLRQAREQNVRLVLLWFGTWKNSAPTYVPEWVKTDTKRFPRLVLADGRTGTGLSPHGAETLEADRRAFVRMMEHLKQADSQHTVIMVQPENEVGSLSSVRDFSPDAQRLFEGAVPDGLAGPAGGKKGSWREVFGDRADQAFSAWHIASYIDRIAAAGKEVLALPMYCNAALSNPYHLEGAEKVASGGPNWNVIDIWKAAAPHIDLVAPDIYNRDHDIYLAYLDHYTRPDNALMVPETGNALDFARFFWPTLGHGAIGFAPFGMDGTSFSNFPLGAQKLDEETIEAFAAPYRLFAPMARDWARISLENPTWGFARDANGGNQSRTMGRWTITAQFGLWQMKERDDPRNQPHPNATRPVGGAVLAQIGPDEFLVAGADIRIRFGSAAGRTFELLSVEEGSFVDGKWSMVRRWNGDQTDFGLNFVEPVMLKVRLSVLP